MRRARIKVQATVPVRRKALQEATNTDSNQPPTSDSTSKVEKIIPEKNQSPEKVENTPESRTETEKLTESVVQPQEEPINYISAPIKSENKAQNTVKENREKNKDENKKETNATVEKQTNNIEVNIETDDSIGNKQLNNSENINEAKIVKTEVDNVKINKQVETLEGSKDGDRFNTQKQMEKEVREIPNQHVEVSPTKHIQNRSCFMRPVPRLDSGGRVRKNSVQGSGASASESEDDSKKSSNPTRVRNDSICSVQSNKDGFSNAHSKIKLGQQKRRLTVSESARKLAEARREFMLKHENKTPDRSELTMYDLIYYNPVSNPMKRSGNPNQAPRKISVCSTVPEDSKDEEEEDEPTGMPVPQVKVGPNGQLIVDEKSLVIEQTKKEKNRSGPIVQDENSGGGFYKRRQKSKEWSKWDTLRFYRALSNIGTDFLLMQRFFPKRTRQELKMKFKKEERMNRKLVEKALKCQVFDMEVLKEEMDAFAEEERKETEMTNSKAESAKKHHKSKRPSRCRFVVGSIEEVEDSCEEDVDDDLSSVGSRDESCQNTSKRSSKRKCKPTTSSEFVNEGEVESCSDTEDTEVYNVKPTRSGRLPKRRKLQAPNVGSSDDSSDPEEEESSLKNSQLMVFKETETRIDTQTQNFIANLIPRTRDIAPGSLVIYANESGEPGKAVVQVYMVSNNYNESDPNSEQNITPVNSQNSEAETVHLTWKE